MDMITAVLIGAGLFILIAAASALEHKSQEDDDEEQNPENWGR